MSTSYSYSRNLCSSALAICCTILVGCGASTPTKTQQPTAQRMGANALYAQGQIYYKHWENPTFTPSPAQKKKLAALDNKDSKQYALKTWQATWQKEQLNTAKQYFAQALEQRPNNALFQLAYYQALLPLLGEQPQFDEAEALTAFNRLHPEVKWREATPAYMAYRIAHDAKRDSAEQIHHLQRAIKQNPRNPQNWYLLALTYQDAKQSWLAAASAKHAWDMSPQTHQYAFIVGSILTDISESRACEIDNKHLIKQSLKYINRAAALDKSNAHYQSYLALAYLQLGLAPLAYHQAKLAFTTHANTWDAELLADASLALNKPSDLEQAISYIEAATNKTKNYRYLSDHYRALQNTLNGNHLNADKHITQSAKTGFRDFYIPASPWLLSIDDPSLLQTSNNTAFVSEILAFLSTDDDNNDDDDERFLNTPDGHCQLPQRHFFVAQKAWFRGDKQLAKKHLQQTVSFGQTQQLAHQWAKVLLKTLDFSS